MKRKPKMTKKERIAANPPTGHTYRALVFPGLHEPTADFGNMPRLGDRTFTGVPDGEAPTCGKTACIVARRMLGYKGALTAMVYEKGKFVVCIQNGSPAN